LRDVAAQIFDLIRALEISSVHHAGLDENEVTKHAGKHLLNGHQRV